MQQLIWQQQGNKYTVSIPPYNAIIVEQANSQRYKARLEGDSHVVIEFWDDFQDFETAEAWILFTIVEIEQGDPTIAQDRLFQTLDLCRALLPATIHPAHLRRLDYIKQWMIEGRTQEMDVMPLSSAQPSSYPLDWVEASPNDYYAETPHGKAIIREIRSPKSSYVIPATITHQVWIEHSTGVTHECQIRFTDFMAAETWIRTTLAELDEPRVAECYLDNIRFTLAICKRVLSGQPDPLHSVRLDYLEMRIEEALL